MPLLRLFDYKLSSFAVTTRNEKPILVFDNSTTNPNSNATSSRSKFSRRSLLTGALVGVGYLSTLNSKPAAAREFVLHAHQGRGVDPKPVFESRMIEHPSPLGFVHCASICQSASGRNLCAWYGGSREGARDVRIWMSDLDRQSGVESSWSPPQSIMDYQIAAHDSNQFVRKVGNALIFCDASDRLWMIYVSIAMGGWATSSLNATYSEDGGNHWSPSQRLWLSPFLNISELVRCPPVHLTSGQIGIPIYHECAGVFPEMLWLDPKGKELEYNKTRICGGRDWLQPSVVPTSPTTAICYLRCANASRRVGYVSSEDAGATWSSPRLLDLPNPNSAVSGIALENGAVLLALNNSTDTRDSFSLAHSPDGIKDWKVIANLDHKLNEKFSYPSMIRGTDGLIHLVYSWQMKKIRHLCFNQAWIDEQLNKPLAKDLNFTDRDASEKATVQTSQEVAI